ncbi:hypothetical protein J6590_105331, partial [Homalodisca vitripennis]
MSEAPNEDRLDLEAISLRGISGPKGAHLHSFLIKPIAACTTQCRQTMDSRLVKVTNGEERRSIRARKIKARLPISYRRGPLEFVALEIQYFPKNRTIAFDREADGLLF